MTTSKMQITEPSPSRASKNQPSFLQKRFFAWLDRRAPRAKSVTLTRSNLYVFPTKIGCAFGGLSILLWMLGTNYQNNLILALSYLLVSLFVVAILHTYANLVGLRIRALGAKPVFAGDMAVFMLEVDGARTKGADNLIIRWWSGQDACFDFTGTEAKHIAVSLKTTDRGDFHPGKLLIESTFPLGIIRCWTWLNLDAQVLVFPRPLEAPMPPSAIGEDEGENGTQVAGGDDFAGLKPYRAGDAIKHIAWKHFARGQGLYTKEYARSEHSEKWLEWQHFLPHPLEERLCILCYWALQFDQAGVPYGLRMPGVELAPETGEGHLLTILSALARYNTSANKVNQ